LISYIISLSKILTSYNSALATKESLEKIGIHAEMFEGTYGNDAVNIFEKENRVLAEITGVNTNTGKFLYPGVKGCFYSHYRLWKKCVELNEAIMIFEDDIVVLNKYKEIEFEEILILSINYDWSISDIWKQYLEEKNEIKEAVAYSSRFIPGASGYIIKPNAAHKLINYYSNSYLPADVAINSKICNLQIHPQLIGRSKTMAEKESMTRRKYW
jgi:GR25 family glycosyltransferase involved in LPS biosynthesis